MQLINVIKNTHSEIEASSNVLKIYNFSPESVVLFRSLSFDDDAYTPRSRSRLSFTFCRYASLTPPVCEGVSSNLSR